ncbi:MAG: WD40 repeat protein [Cyclobacteriaceae bacterium]|jgi:WD40 repeat protein
MNSSYYSAGGDGKIIKHSITTGTSETVISEKTINRIGSISPDERYLAYITSRDEMAIVDLLCLDERPQDVNGHTGSIEGFAFFPDSSGHYVTVGIDHQVILHSVDASRVLFVCDYPPTTLELSPSGDLLALGGRSGEFEIFSFNAANAKADLVYRIRREGIAIQKVSFSADGQKIALGISNYSDSYGFVEIRDVMFHGS